jgi:hypothetical protein
MFAACEKSMAKTNMYQDKKNPTLCNNILQKLKKIMYDKDGRFWSKCWNVGNELAIVYH